MAFFLILFSLLFFQLRVLFAILAAVGSGAAMLLRDLEDPFQGSFCINLAAKQLNAFQHLLEADIDEAQQEQQQVGRSAFLSLDRNRSRLHYNTRNTLYFHLLTGPLGSNVKFFGDILSWTVRHMSNAWKRVWKWPRRAPPKAVNAKTGLSPALETSPLSDIADAPPLKEQLRQSK